MPFYEKSGVVYEKFEKRYFIFLYVGLLLIGGFFAVHWFTTASATSMDNLSRQATAYLKSQELMHLQEVSQRANFLAALCAPSDEKMVKGIKL